MTNGRKIEVFHNPALQNARRKAPFVNIALIGMPGSGKSTIGRGLARRMDGWRSVDTDELLTLRAGQTLENLNRFLLPEAFLDIEEATILDLNGRGNIWSTGGSVIYRSGAMEHLRELALLIYLEVDYEVLAQRVGNPAHRGVVLPNGQSFEKLYAERTPLYREFADLTINTSSLTARTTVDELLPHLNRLV
ncbi:MAG: shikimate kinase [Clostridiaceae bacterium]|nr:shikimate kinase [Clostridiaceae bacterium]